MNETDIQSVISKVQKLLALSKNNTSEAEMKAAASAADRIMQAYRLTQAQVEAQVPSQAEPIVRKVVKEGGRRTSWRETLLYALTTSYGSAWYLSSYRSGGEGGRGGGKGAKGTQSYTVVGKQSDVEIVLYMFSYLEGEIERLCRWYAGGKGVKYAAAWLCGCATGVSAQFSEQRASARTCAQAEGVSAALVLLDKRQAESKEHMSKYVGTKLAKGISGGTDYNARAAGYGVGKTVSIRQGMTAGANASPKLTQDGG